MSWVAIGVAVAGAAITGGVAYEQNQQTNRAARKAAGRTALMAAQQGKQVNETAALEAAKRRSEAEKIRGLIRVRMADQGGDATGSFDALIRQANYDESLNLSILSLNRKNQLTSVEQGAQFRIEELLGNLQSPILSALIGSEQGASTGLSIASSAKEVSRK